jgi:hypothetical protein
MNQIISFCFAIDGFSITYSDSNREINSLSFDPLSTCNLFQHFSIIEGFDIDRNGEPVILYTDSYFHQPVTGWSFWCDFVKSYPFTGRHAELIAEAIEDHNYFRNFESIINTLLEPLEA